MNMSHLSSVVAVGLRIAGALSSVAVVALGCTRGHQALAAEKPQGTTDEASAASLAGRSARLADDVGPARSARLYTLPAGCVPAGEKIACHPLTNAGCKTNGEACDDDTKGGFMCYPPPNEVGEGGECNDKEGPSCAPGMSCDTPTESSPDGICRKLCCSAADCARTRRCVPVDPQYGTFGFCK
jgi:hypothetical protein